MFIFALMSMLCYVFSIGHCSEQCSLMNFVLNTSFDNTLITNFTLLTKSGGGSKSACAADCSRDQDCVSFFYNNQSDVCTAHSVQFYSTELSISDVGSMYYTMPIDKQSCAEILCHVPTSIDGVYIINPLDGKGPLRVYCDMTTDGGGWTVLQRRQDGSINFNRDWKDYKNGFGDLEGEFWQGNDIINRLTTARETKLRVDMLDQENQIGYATYSRFSVDNEANNYVLSVDGFSGNVGDALDFHNGRMFTTWDRDNGDWARRCYSFYPGGWWLSLCIDANFNGEYDDNTPARGILWGTWHGTSYSLKRTEMKLRPAQSCTANE